MASRASSWTLVALGALALACHSTGGAKGSPDQRPSPASSGRADGDAGRVVKTFPAHGISRVVFRAMLASEARIVTAPGADIRVAGTPQGGAPGYHPSDPKWRETSAQDWGLGFREKAFGSTLVISTWNEIHYIHHSYYLDQLVISVPPGIEVTLEARRLTGEGAPDLGPPGEVTPSSAPPAPTPRSS